MRFLSYGRKSTDKMDGVDRQIELCHDEITRLGGEIGPDFRDNDVSGAKFDRLGLNGLLTTMRPGDGIMMMDASRLGREQSETLALQVRIVKARVRIFHYQDGQELKVDTATQKLVAQIHNFGHENFRDEIREKTRQALHKIASQGHVAGGKVYGYNIAQENGHKVRMVNQAQAQVVRKVFQAVADGLGLLRIVRILNAEGIAAPQSGHVCNPTCKHKPMSKAWKVSGVRWLLDRPIYRGEIVYGTTTKLDAPHLRIVDEVLWKAAHNRLADTRAKHPGVRDAKGRLHGSVAVDTGLDSRHLLSGFLRCGSCGGNMKLSAISHKGGKVWKGWYCARRYQQGNSALDGCKGSVPYDAIASAVRGALDPKAIEAEIIAYLKTIAAPGPEDQRDRIVADLAKAEKEEQSYADAIGLGGDLPVLVAKLKGVSFRCESLRASLASHQAIADNLDDLDPEDLADALRLTQEGSPDLTADRKVLRSLGVQITVDQALREAVIDGNLYRIVASRLSSHAPSLWEARG
jgi:site-specific DNA recombinase